MFKNNIDNGALVVPYTRAISGGGVAESGKKFRMPTAFRSRTELRILIQTSA